MRLAANNSYNDVRQIPKTNEVEDNRKNDNRSKSDQQESNASCRKTQGDSSALDKTSRFLPIVDDIQCVAQAFTPRLHSIMRCLSR